MRTKTKTGTHTKGDNNEGSPLRSSPNFFGLPERFASLTTGYLISAAVPLRTLFPSCVKITALKISNFSGIKTQRTQREDAKDTKEDT
jgi:hypothetical protein